MLRAVLNKSSNQYFSKEQLYDNQPPISQTIQDEQDMRGTAGKIRIDSKLIFSNGILHIDAPGLANQQGLTYISSVWILNSV